MADVRALRRLAVVVGVTLLALNLSGLLTSPSFDVVVTSGERFDPALAASTRSVEALLAAADVPASADPTATMDALFDVVTRRFTHGDRTYGVRENWLLALLGRVHEAFGHIRDPEALLDRSPQALCSEQSYVLMSLASARGIATRHVGLYGHVVMEAWLDEDWRMYDPDFEVASPAGVRALSCDADAVRAVYADSTASPGEIDALVAIYTSREDNSFVAYPNLAQFEWKSQVLLLFERMAGWLKWLIPVGLLAIAARKVRRRDGPSPASRQL
ncbi:MAG: hypothetical protein ABS36_15695 [Acidobacteria bacterium SCN 69-37]|nr:MAG: hypothetical protein ABS36_15695 [Acidobacteria bacterium SCN 69-37]